MSGGVRDHIQQALTEAVRGLGVEGEIPDLELGRAKVAGHGEYASSAGLKLARQLRQDPRAIANTVVKRFDSQAEQLNPFEPDHAGRLEHIRHLAVRRR